MCIRDRSHFLLITPVVVNVVMATDIFDKELQDLRKNRWEKAFAADESTDCDEVVNLKATIVIEHIMQARSVSWMLRCLHTVPLQALLLLQ